MSKETRIGIFAAIALAVLIIGFYYLKGLNIFESSRLIYSRFDNVEQLAVSDPVYLSGVPVGIVQEIAFDPEDQGQVIIGLNIKDDIKLPKTTEAQIVSGSLMGGKSIVLKTRGRCSGQDCLQAGDFISGRSVGMLEGLLGGSDEDGQASTPQDQMMNSMGPVMDSLFYSISDPNATHNLARSFANMERAMANLEQTTKRLDGLMNSSSRKLNTTLDNFSELSSTLSAQNESLQATISNFRSFSTNLKETDIAGVVSEAKGALSTTDKTIASLETTLNEAKASMSELNELLSAVNNGSGTLGKLMTNDELYNRVLRTSTNLDLLLQDFRLNPRRYVNVSVFGKKDKGYTLPENDPAFRPSSDK